MRLKGLQEQIINLKKLIDCSQSTKDCALFLLLLTNSRAVKGQSTNAFILNSESSQILHRPKEISVNLMANRLEINPIKSQIPKLENNKYDNKQIVQDSKSQYDTVYNFDNRNINSNNKEIRDKIEPPSQEIKRFDKEKDPPRINNFENKDTSLNQPQVQFKERIENEFSAQIPDHKNVQISEQPQFKSANPALPPLKVPEFVQPPIIQEEIIIPSNAPKINQPPIQVPKPVEPVVQNQNPISAPVQPPVQEPAPIYVQPKRPEVVQPQKIEVVQPQKIEVVPPQNESEVNPPAIIEETKEQIEERANQEKLMNLLSTTYNKHFSSTKQFAYESTLNLILNKKEAQGFIQEYVQTKEQLPNIHKLMIGFPNYCMEDFKQFIFHCFPNNVEIFVVNGWNHSAKKLGDASLYSDMFEEKLKNVTTEVNLIEHNMISSQVFSQIVRGSSNSERIVFRACEIPTDSECNFGSDIHYNTQFISFGYSGRSDICKWRGSKNRFENIVKGISRSTIKNSLKEINANPQSITEQQIKELLGNHNARNITVSMEKS